jgi:hypothetical protein
MCDAVPGRLNESSLVRGKESYGQRGLVCFRSKNQEENPSYADPDAPEPAVTIDESAGRAAGRAVQHVSRSSSCDILLLVTLQHSFCIVE